MRGRQTYRVIIQCHGNKIERVSCNCPHDAYICKHTVAALFDLRDYKELGETAVAIEAQQHPFVEILQNTSHEELVDFLISYADKHPELRSVIQVQLGTVKGSVKDIFQETLQMIQDTEPADYDFDGYNDDIRSLEAVSDLGDDLLNKARTAIHKKEWETAFGILLGLHDGFTAIEKELEDNYYYEHDGRISIDACASEALALFYEHVEDAPKTIQLQLFDFICQQLNDSNPNSKKGLIDTLIQLAHTKEQTDTVLSHIELQLSKHSHSEWGQDKWLHQKMRLFSGFPEYYGPKSLCLSAYQHI